MQPAWLFLAFIVFVLAIQVLALYYRRELGTLRWEDAKKLTLPLTTIADARDGWIRIVGIAKTNEPVYSYYDRVPCVARKVEQLSDGGTKLGVDLAGPKLVHTTVIERTLQIAPFTVDDGTGSITVDPKRVRFDFEVAGGEEASLLEHRIRDGEKVALIARVIVHPEAGYRTSAERERLTLETAPLVSWRSDEEFAPRLRPPTLALVLAAVGVFSIGMFGYGLYQRAQRRARYERMWRSEQVHPVDPAPRRARISSRISC